jgi:hypothetical protein
MRGTGHASTLRQAQGKRSAQVLRRGSAQVLRLPFDKLRASAQGPPNYGLIVLVW